MHKSNPMIQQHDDIDNISVFPDSAVVRGDKFSRQKLLLRNKTHY